MKYYILQVRFLSYFYTTVPHSAAYVGPSLKEADFLLRGK